MSPLVRTQRSSRGRRIFFIQYTNPAAYPPLEHSSRILAEAGWQVLFLGTRAQGANLLRFGPHDNIQVFQMSFCQAGWRQKLHYLKFCTWIVGWALLWRPRWIYASDFLASPIALLLSWLPGIRVIYHEHDTPATETGSAFIRLCLGTRRLLAQRAALCLFPNQQRAERFAATAEVKGTAVCVWNCPALEEASQPKVNRSGNTLAIFYHGSIGPLRLPLEVIRALALLPAGVTLRIAGYETVGHPDYVLRLKDEANRLGLGESVDYIGTLPTRHELLEACSGCDVGLALMPKAGTFNMQNMVGASNKPFDYLARGLALLVSDLPAWREMYAEPGYGLCCDPTDPKSIATALNWFLEHAAETRAMGEQGRQKILAEWNYETQFSPILMRLNCD